MYCMSSFKSAFNTEMSILSNKACSFLEHMVAYAVILYNLNHIIILLFELGL